MSASVPALPSTRLAWPDTSQSSPAQSRSQQDLRRLAQMIQHDIAEQSKFLSPSASAALRSEGEAKIESLLSQRTIQNQSHSSARPMTAPAQRRIETDAVIADFFSDKIQQIPSAINKQ